MSTPEPDRKPWYYTRGLWAAELEARRHDAERDRRRAQDAARPVVPPGIPATAWARMTEVERAQATAAQRRHEQVLASQRRTRTTLIMIFVVIPLVVLLLVGIYALATAATNAHLHDNGAPAATRTLNSAA